MDKPVDNVDNQGGWMWKTRFARFLAKPVPVANRAAVAYAKWWLQTRVGYPLTRYSEKVRKKHLSVILRFGEGSHGKAGDYSVLRTSE